MARVPGKLAAVASDPLTRLGLGHVARLGALPADARELPGGKFELAIGEIDEWLFGPSVNVAEHPFDLAPHRRNPGIQSNARRVLAPCLLKEDDEFPEPRRHPNRHR